MEGLIASKYIYKIHTLSHNLVAIWKPILGYDLVLYALVGLSYNPLVTSINMMNEKPNFSSFHSQLEIYERMIVQKLGSNKEWVSYAHYAFTNRSFSTSKFKNN